MHKFSSEMMEGGKVGHAFAEGEEWIWIRILQ